MTAIRFLRTHGVYSRGDVAYFADDRATAIRSTGVAGVATPDEIARGRLAPLAPDDVPAVPASPLPEFWEGYQPRGDDVVLAEVLRAFGPYIPHEIIGVGEAICAELERRELVRRVVPTPE